MQSVTITFHHTSCNSYSSDARSNDGMSISVILFIISRLLVCQYRFTRNLSSAYQTLRRKCGMQYRSRYF
jgi:hypothetical protein